jgi:hypothetical protein
MFIQERMFLKMKNYLERKSLFLKPVQEDIIKDKNTN